MALEPRPKFPDEKPKITLEGQVEATCIMDTSRYSTGNMLFRIADCTASATIDGREVEVGASAGAQIFVSISNKKDGSMATYLLDREHLIKAVLAAHDETHVVER